MRAEPLRLVTDDPHKSTRIAFEDHQHEMNLAVQVKFEEAVIPFACPAQTIFTKSFDAA